MKWKSSVLIVLMLITIPATFIGCSNKGGFKDYKDLINKYMDAISKEDFNLLIKCYNNDEQKNMKVVKKDIIDELEDLNADYKKLIKKTWRKDASSINEPKKLKSKSYSIDVGIKSSTKYLTFYLEKIDDRYFIDAGDDEFFSAD